METMESANEYRWLFQIRFQYIYLIANNSKLIDDWPTFNEKKTISL